MAERYSLTEITLDAEFALRRRFWRRFIGIRASGPSLRQRGACACQWCRLTPSFRNTASKRSVDRAGQAPVRRRDVAPGQTGIDTPARFLLDLPHMQRGLFVSFEGSEGCGKSTQIKLLAARCEEAGRRVLVTREPGGTPLGEEIRQLLQFSPLGHAMKDETELLLFTASRAQLTRESIEPALAEGVLVLADRFLDSTTVYQGVARRLDPEAVRFINDFAVGACRPDLTFVFDLDPAEARRRLLRRPRPLDQPDRMEHQPASFYEDVRAGYLALAAREPDRIRVLDASRSIPELETEIWDHVQHYGLLETRSA